MNISLTTDQERIVKEGLEANPARYDPISLSGPVSGKTVSQDLCVCLESVALALIELLRYSARVRLVDSERPSNIFNSPVDVWQS